MTMIARLAEHYITASRQLDRISSEALPIIARLIFGITLVAFFWRSGLTKLGDGLAGFVIPSAGALAGVTAGGLAAAIYAMVCIEDNPGFYGLWYSVDMLITGVIGAVLGKLALKW